MPTMTWSRRFDQAEWRMTSSVVVVLLVAGAALTSCTRSQTAADDCARANKVVHRGRTMQNDDRIASSLPGCGAIAGKAASDAWRATRSMSDTAQIAKVYDRLVELRDS